MTTENLNILYLCRKDVEAACQGIDSVALMREVFTMHALNQTILPEEAYLGWNNDNGEAVRSLCMPSYLDGSLRVAGTKIINGNISNPARGLPRASAVTLLFDNTSGRIRCIMEGAYISSLRTASVTAMAVDLLKVPDLRCAAIIGAGVLAQAHIALLLEYFPQIEQIQIFDVNAQRIELLQRNMASLLQKHQKTLQQATTAEAAIREAQLIIPVTTTTIGYIRFEWLQPGSVLVNVSLDDPLPEVVMKATTVIVDDWQLVKSDTRRLLGRLYRAGWLLGPDESSERLSSFCRRVDMQMSQLLVGEKVGRRSSDDIILVNPFGLSIEDIALASQVYQKALSLGIGLWLEY